jgi:hypothetical protein
MTRVPATPEESAAFNTWLVATAEIVANAAKEGGFLGGEQAIVFSGSRRCSISFARPLA